MKGTMIKTAAVLAMLGALASGGVLAHGGQGSGSGMMGGYGGQGMGPGMMGGYGGQGMGPGMMGHGMMGHGMMGPGMMGPGMMGPGMMGPGMMGPGMMGPGMMGGIGPYASGVLGLSEEQRQRLEAIQRDNAREHWQLMQGMREHQQEMMQLHSGGEIDPDKLGRVWDNMAAAQRRMLEQRARMHNQMREVLTEEQRERLDQMQRYGFRGYEDNQ